MRHRLISLRPTYRIGARLAIGLLAKGARWIGPKDDPVFLAAVDPALLPLAELLAMPMKVAEAQNRLKRMLWMPDRVFLLEKMDFCLKRSTAWIRKRLYSALLDHEEFDRNADIGALFGKRLNAVPDDALWVEMESLAATCETPQEWITRLPSLLVQWLPRLDRADEPIDIQALPTTPLASAIRPLVLRRRQDLASVQRSLLTDTVELTPLKSTVYGRMILDELSLLEKDQLTSEEARDLKLNFQDLLRGLNEEG